MKHTIETITPDSHPDCFYTPQPWEIQVGQEVWIKEYGRHLGPYKWEKDIVGVGIYTSYTECEPVCDHGIFIDALNDNVESVKIRKLLTRTIHPELFPDGVQDDLEALGWNQDQDTPRYKYILGKHEMYIFSAFTIFRMAISLYKGPIRNRFHLERLMDDFGIRKEETK